MRTVGMCISDEKNPDSMKFENPDFGFENIELVFFQELFIVNTKSSKLNDILT
jgi:hypothetical protein